MAYKRLRRTELTDHHKARLDGAAARRDKAVEKAWADWREVVRDLIDRENYTQRVIADHVGRSHQMVGNWARRARERRERET